MLVIVSCRQGFLMQKARLSDKNAVTILKWEGSEQLKVRIHGYIRDSDTEPTTAEMKKWPELLIDLGEKCL